MALDATEKEKVRFYLGYSTVEDGGHIQRALDGLESRPGADVIIRENLEALTVLDAEIAKLPTLALAVQDGAIHLRAHYSLGVMRSMGRQHVHRLATYIAVPIKADVFAPGGTGDVISDPTQSNYNLGKNFSGGGCDC